MNILMITHRLPYPPHKGTQVRPYNMIKSFHDRGHEVHLVCLSEERSNLEASTALSELCGSVRVVNRRHIPSMIRALISLLRGASLTEGYFSLRKLNVLVGDALETSRIDAIVAFSSSTAQFVPREWRTKALMDMTDVDSEKWNDYAKQNRFPRSWVYALEARRLRQYEIHIAQEFARTSLATSRETELLACTCPEVLQKLLVIPNGVDLDFFRPRTADDVEHLLDASERPRWTSRSRSIILFTGAMDYFPNVTAVEDFATRVLPLVRESIPDASFWIVGSNPKPSVRALERIPGVQVTGFVKDMRPYFAIADVCVVPLRIARGIQNKALEAMASGCALLISGEASLAIGGTAGRDYVVSDDPVTTAVGVCELLLDPALRSSIGASGRKFVERRYQWSAAMSELDRALAQMLGAGGSG
jgi:sugar transferase (PEP-CTERM/EpsH1 system associated)